MTPSIKPQSNRKQALMSIGSLLPDTVVLPPVFSSLKDTAMRIAAAKGPSDLVIYSDL